MLPRFIDSALHCQWTVYYTECKELNIVNRRHPVCTGVSSTAKKQALWALQAEDRQRVFIEAGAFDGSLLSNSIYFELKYNWTGLLVEPDPQSYKIMKGTVATFSSIITNSALLSALGEYGT